VNGNARRTLFKLAQSRFFLFYGCAKTIAAIYWEINKILLEMGKQLKKNLRTRGDDYDK